MSIVAGVDFGTLSVRVAIFDSVKGRLGAGTAAYPLFRTQEDPDHATQSHADHMAALALATHRAIDDAAIDGHAIAGLALDTTGSSVIPVDAHLQPIDDYYLWCDHRAWREAAEITAAAHAANLEAIDWCGGVCAPESPSPPAPSTPTGTPSAPASAWATWSTWWVLPPASWRSVRPTLT